MACLRVLVTGGDGLVGSALVPELRSRGHEVIAPSRRQMDLTGDPTRVHDAVREASPHAVVNLAGYTDVDGAERDTEAAMRVNRDGAGVVAAAAAASGAHFLQLSTDYVFDGRADRPYPPEAALRPLGVYGRSKAEGEERVRGAGGSHLIVRTSWLYGAGGRSFVDAVLRRARRGETLRVVSDQRGAPTWTRSLALGLAELMEEEERGTLHLTDEGEATWHDLAVEALRLAGLDGEVQPISSAAWGAAAPRPAYSVLDLSATRGLLKRPLPHWRESLALYVEELTS
ncbi:MAG: dTDP-4-dehydrorhamnose reductase [Gemmatimonadetes bacterium]|nr:dTDP-4-dehydrorhamnose reductase [Gemmatimonadota bacterium]